MQSPLQLISRKFIDIELHPQERQDGPNGFRMTHMIAVDQNTEEPTHWKAKVGVKIENKEGDNPASYVGEITVGGSFVLSEKFPADKAEAMVSLNAGAILYGAIRELVISLTSQSVHGEFILPTLDARTFLPSTEEKEEKSEAPS
jgi:preprotein translocase subunit SecB